MLYEARPWQEPLTKHILAMPRCNVFAKPGMGKTASTLMALELRGLVADSYPALVVAPPRVANTVWSKEVEQWAQFRGLTVSKVLGNSQQRRQALSKKADIYTIHFGLLTWLAEYMDNRWPFKTVIADESSRLKNTRAHFRKSKDGTMKLVVQGGSKNAGALARYARATPYWINLTGTPASNGLQDLYGQHWFIDFGKTLGASYSAFSARWFFQKRGTSAEAGIFLPHAHAFDEITERMKPTTLSLNPRDWFDIREPRVVDIEVELSEGVMKKYRAMHNRMVLELSAEKNITAVNAGAMINKLLQMTGGYMIDNDGVPQFMHDEKLQALESLVENQCGAPLVVAYWFKADRDAILKRIPGARVLGKGNAQKQSEDDWNAGKIPVLLLNPGSAGHGLSLQYGGCDICFYSTGWDAESTGAVVTGVVKARHRCHSH